MPGSATDSVLILASPRDRGAVAAARALHAAGWRVDAGCPDPGGGLVGTSRAVDRVHVVPRPRGRARDFIAAIHQAHASRKDNKGTDDNEGGGGYDLVFGAGDDWLAALSHYRDRLPMRVAHPSKRAVDRAGDKLLLARWAEEAGLATPLTVPATEEVLADLREDQFPVVVKNRRHWRPGQNRTFRLETQVCHSRDELDRMLAETRSDGDEPILQEHRTGGLGALIGLFHEGKLVGRVQQVSPRLWPTPAGASARARTVPVDRALAAAAERLLARLGWEGLVELQFLIDDDGTHRLIDFNGRFFGSLALSERARPGMVDAWARQAADRHVPWLEDGKPGLRYQWFPGDLRRAFVERRGGLVPDVVGTVLQGFAARHSVLHWTDPGPAMSLLADRFPRQGDVARPAGDETSSDETGDDVSSVTPIGPAPFRRSRYARSA